MIPSDTDVAVVGGGVGGLTCAAMLARAGQRVVVLEQAARIGGCCMSFQSDGFTFDAAVHHVSGGGPRSLLGRALAAAGARVSLVHLDPMDVLVWPDLRFVVPGDWDRFGAELVRAFPREARGIVDCLQGLLRLYRATLGSPRGEALLERWADATVLEFLAHHLGDERVIRILSGQWGYLGVPPARLSAVGMCQMVVNYWRDGAYYPHGGIQAIPNALGDAVEAAGGSVVAGAAVRRILVAGGRATGVELASGHRIRARWVVANVDVPQLVSRLLAGGVPLAYRERVDSLETSAPFFILYLGLDGRFPLARLPRGFYHREARLDGPWLYLSSGSEIDPSLAPPGMHALTVVVSLDPAAAAYRTWRGRVDEAVQETIGVLDQLAPGLARHVVHARAAHPPDQPHRMTANFCGAPYGWAVTPAQAGPQRLEPQTPIDNLLLAGHWTSPGPGVCAVVGSGWRTANAVLARAKVAGARPLAVEAVAT